MTHRTLITIATYNERENLPLLLELIFEHAPEVDVLVIDDNSPDGTGPWCDEYSVTDPRVHCLHRSGKLGLGTAILDGMRYAIEHGYDFVLNMDADLSHHPKHVPELIAGMHQGDNKVIDVMIGSRYIPGGGAENWPLLRHVMSRGVNVYTRIFLGLSPRDCSGSYRCYRVELLRQLDFDSVVARGYAFQEEILWHLKRAGARFGETPIVFADRVHGQSKIDARETGAAIWRIFALGMRNWFGPR